MTRSSPRIIFALLFALLISGCGGGGGDSASNVVGDPPAAPQDGISGTVQSRINGASISVTDANGQDITVASGGTTDGAGRFNLVFSEFSINSGINAPLIITVDAGGATAICDYDLDSDNDCQNADGTFVSYGESYTLASDFTLRGVASTFPPATTAGDRRIQVNVSAASEIAASLAGSSGQATLTESNVDTAASQALGVVEFITGLPTKGKSINEISIADLTQANAPDSSAMAVALFAASQHGKVDATRPGRATYRRVLNDVLANLSVDQGSNLLEARGSWLTEAVNAYLTGAIAYQNSLGVDSPVLAGAIASQTVTQDLLRTTGFADVPIAEPADPNSDEPLDRAKMLTNRLTEAVGATLLISTTDGFGGTATGAATVYGDQVSLLNTIASTEVRSAIILLDEALEQALADGETQLTGTNVSGVLAFDGNTVDITTATTTTSNIQTGTSVNISIQNGVRTNPGGDGDFTMDEIILGVTKSQDNATTQELFEGSASLIMKAGTDTADASSVQYDGDVRAASGLSFSGDMLISALSTVDVTPLVGNYEADFIFADQSSLSMTGTLQSGISAYQVNTLSSGILVDLITNVVTDFVARLNLAINAEGNAVTGGTLTSDDVISGTMDAEGVVEFSDGTTIVLPAPII